MLLYLRSVLGSNIVEVDLRLVEGGLQGGLEARHVVRGVPRRGRWSSARIINSCKQQGRQVGRHRTRTHDIKTNGYIPGNFNFIIVVLDWLGYMHIGIPAELNPPPAPLCLSVCLSLSKVFVSIPGVQHTGTWIDFTGRPSTN